VSFEAAERMPLAKLLRYEGHLHAYTDEVREAMKSASTSSGKALH